MNTPTAITRSDLRELIEFNASPCVSIYMPTHPTGTEMQQDPIRLKNLLGAAEEQLTSDGLRRPEAEEMLRPGRELLQDDLFWEHQRTGLACFFGPDFARGFRLPRRFEEAHHVADGFIVQPLLPLFESDARFHILALSQQQVKLYEAAGESLYEIHLEGLPLSVADVTPERGEDETLQYHRESPAQPSADPGSPMYHGHGGAADKSKADILTFCHRVDERVSAYLRQEQTPLVLACVGFVAAIYEEANTYDKLLTGKVPGNPESWSPEELLQKARDIARPYVEKDRRDALGRFLEQQSTTWVSQDAADVVPSADVGRVDTLFVNDGVRVLGEYDREQASAKISDEGRDLTNFAAVRTLVQDGRVFTVGEDDIPGDFQLAAVYRYPSESITGSEE